MLLGFLQRILNVNFAVLFFYKYQSEVSAECRKIANVKDPQCNFELFDVFYSHVAVFTVFSSRVLMCGVL